MDRNTKLRSASSCVDIHVHIPFQHLPHTVCPNDWMTSLKGTLQEWRNAAGGNGGRLTKAGKISTCSRKRSNEKWGHAGEVIDVEN